MLKLSDVLNNLYNYITPNDLIKVYHALYETVLKEPDTYYEPTLRCLLSEMYAAAGSTRLITTSLVALRARCEEVINNPERFSRRKVSALTGIYWYTLDYLAQELPSQTFKQYCYRNKHLFELL